MDGKAAGACSASGRRAYHRAVPRRFLCLLVVVIACAGCAARHEPDASVSADLERLAAVERCATAFGKLAQGSADSASVLAACAGMRARPACRDPLAAAGGLDAAVAAMLGPCRDAYCPDLPAPRPAACAGQVVDRMTAAAELDTAILAFELSARREDVARVSLFRQITVVPAIRIDRPRAPTAEATIALRVAAGRVAVTVDKRRWSLSAAPAPSDLAPIVAALPPPTPELQIVLEADASVSHGTVIALMQALKERGYVRMAIATKGH
jgi:biopolymer transport protein ExbD